MGVCKCWKCGAELNEENWFPSRQKKLEYICKGCNRAQGRLWRKANPEKSRAKAERWRKANPEKVRVANERRRREAGGRSFDENKKCSMFLGIHVAERVLSHVFKNVHRMPMHNPGYDFICNKGMKIDVKSSCIRKDGGWAFHISRNITADYFLCLAFDNRENLKPLYIWLIPGNVLGHLVHTSVGASTISKWDKYKLDISNVSTCCDVLKLLGGQ